MINNPHPYLAIEETAIATPSETSLAQGADAQGFITSRNRFVTRTEGHKLQDAAGIPSADPEGYRGDTLFSEDLY